MKGGRREAVSKVAVGSRRGSTHLTWEHRSKICACLHVRHTSLKKNLIWDNYSEKRISEITDKVNTTRHFKCRVQKRTQNKEDLDDCISQLFWLAWKKMEANSSNMSLEKQEHKLSCLTFLPQQYPRPCMTGSISDSNTSASLEQYLYTRDVLRLYSQALLNISQMSSTYCQGSWYCPVSSFRLMVDRSMGFLTMSK